MAGRLEGSYADLGRTPKIGDLVRTCLGAVALSEVDKDLIAARRDGVTGNIAGEVPGNTGMLWLVAIPGRQPGVYGISEMIPLN